jgi:hypothetical protein
MMRCNVALLLVLALTLVGISGCTGNVKPWERGNLAKREMAIVPNPALRKLREHVFVSKEAALGGFSGSAGGCGCN